MYDVRRAMSTFLLGAFLMDRPQMELRLKQFALRVMRLVDALPKSATGRAIASQLVRSGTSIGANYRAAGRGRSTADFIAKLAIAEEEADETVYWIELIIEGGLVSTERAHPLLTEANELVSIIAASRIKAKRSRTTNRRPPQ